MYLKEVILDAYENKNTRKEHYGTMALLQALLCINRFQKDVQTTWITKMLVQSLKPATWSIRVLIKNQGANTYLSI